MPQPTDQKADAGIEHGGANDGPLGALMRVVALIRDDPLDPALYRTLARIMVEAREAGHLRLPSDAPAGLPIDLQRALNALQQDDLVMAELILRARLLDDPEDVGAARLMAELARKLDMLDQAERMLEYAHELAPADKSVKIDLAKLLRQRNSNERALRIVDELLADDPKDRFALYIKAMVSAQMGQADAAVELFERLTHLDPEAAAVWIGYGRALKTRGRTADAETAFRTAAELNPRSGEAWWSLSDLKTVRFSAEDIAEMETRLEKGGLTEAEKCYVHFALGKAFEDAKDYKPSFSHYLDGNAIRRRSIEHDPARFTEYVDRAIARFDRDFFTNRAGFGHDAADPVFVLGMTRAGSTLVEQILASHSAIEGTMELVEMLNVARSLSEEFVQRVDAVASIDREQAKELGERYIRDTRQYRFSDRPLFIDKMPNNWLYVPLIHQILPNARIIDARRHPMACCFSNFKQNFGKGQDWSYQLTELGTYYRKYVEYMDHIDTVLPGRVYRLYHERLVDEPEREIRKLLEYVGVPFEESCLAFHKTERPVRTASAAQVRQPLSRRGIDLWEKYREWLGPLEAALGDTLADYPV